MKKSVKNGTIHMESEKNEPFINKDWALYSMQALQLALANQGLSVYSRIYFENKNVELSVHFDLSNYPKIPRGYLYTRRDITSHIYYSAVTKEPDYVRTMDFYFEY